MCTCVALLKQWTSFSNSTPKNLSGCKVLSKSENLNNFDILAHFYSFWGSKFQNYRKWTSFSNSTHKNLSGCKILAKSEKLQNFAFFAPFCPFWGSNFQNF